MANVRASLLFKYPGAHSILGLLRQISAKVAADSLDMRLKWLLGRRDFAFATLIL